MDFQIVDDGTLDTVVRCNFCNKTERLNSDAWEVSQEMADDDVLSREDWIASEMANAGHNDADCLEEDDNEACEEWAEF